MKARDRLIAQRRRLLVTGVDTDYRFIGLEGEVDLLELFQGRRQLIIYRFFCAPDVEDWPDGACNGCSMFADTIAHPGPSGSLRHDTRFRHGRSPRPHRAIA
jgi:predicted dithiol-disulfide oxidoreductase (DUF899 family)